VNRQLIESAVIISRSLFKLRVEGSYLGILWYLLEPLALFAILLTIRGIIGAGIEHYPAYLIVGLILFNFFRKTTQAAANCINANSSLITGLNTRPELFVLASFGMGVFIHAFEMIVIAGVLYFTGLPLIYLTLYGFVFLIFAPFVLAACFFLASIGVYVNDIDNLWAVLTRLLWFATPIFYKSMLNLPFNLNNVVNPMYHFITFTRDMVIYHRMPDMVSFLCVAIFSVVMLLLGYNLFRRLEINFAERI
jgi:ABC-2 type transport system permease protein